MFNLIDVLQRGYRDMKAHDDLVMSLWLADFGVNWLIQKERSKTEREDRRQTRRREKKARREIDEPVQRREPKVERTEDSVSDVAKAEARRRLEQALERSGVGGVEYIPFSGKVFITN